MFRIVLLRANGRFVKDCTRPARRAAVHKAHEWENSHDKTFYVEIRAMNGEVIYQSPTDAHDQHTES